MLADYCQYLLQLTLVFTTAYISIYYVYSFNVLSRGHIMRTQICWYDMNFADLIPIHGHCVYYMGV